LHETLFPIIMIIGNSVSVYNVKMPMYYSRILNILDTIQKKSCFLFGPRSIGKTTLIKSKLPNALYFDLLDADVFYKLARHPKYIAESIQGSNQIIVIDEIQKMPQILNEVHRIIENSGNHFLLTGSSARTLRRKGVNLLGGRAWQMELFPFVSKEIKDFDLMYYLNRGGIPSVYLSENPSQDLKHYVNLYIKEEIVAEALSRRIDYFARFLEIMALNNGEELSYQSLASDAGVPVRTLQNYVHILEDTLLGFQVFPFLRTKKRKAISRSKFYFFDIGVVNTLAKRSLIEKDSELFGRAFEHFIILEIRAYLSYFQKSTQLSYWRSTSGFEVDIVLGESWAIEIKSTSLVTERHLKGLKALQEEGLVKNFAVISHDSSERVIDGIQIFPWEIFLKKLWNSEIDVF
jgi:uncharacterized protein